MSNEEGNMGEQTFLLKHGDNTTQRIAPDILEALHEHLSKGILYKGKIYQVKKLGEIDLDSDGYCRLLFDIKDIEGFDHIEFSIRKTGWGRALEQPILEKGVNHD